MLYLLLVYSMLSYAKLAPIDSLANSETKKLFLKMHKLKSKGAMFGHQNSEREGHLISWPLMSDIKKISGDEPAIVGYDFREVAVATSPTMIEQYLTSFQKVHARGGIITLSWHMDNPASNGGYYDKTPAIHRIIPGGDLHQIFLNELDKLAHFANQIPEIPIIFRPYHEHNYDWFWWDANRSENDFIKLWRMTVNYLKNKKKVHNFLYTYSPDKFYSYPQYFFGYPGDKYIDILGVDFYTNHLSEGLWQLEFLLKESKRRNKLAALTETGVEGIQFPTFWSENILRPLESLMPGLSYLMLWRNSKLMEHHFYVPYPGHSSVGDFLKMKTSKKILFESNINDV